MAQQKVHSIISEHRWKELQGAVLDSTLRDPEFGHVLDEAWNVWNAEERRHLIGDVKALLGNRRIGDARTLLKQRGEQSVESVSALSRTLGACVPKVMRDWESSPDVLSLLVATLLVWMAPFRLAFGYSSLDWIELFVTVCALLQWFISPQTMVITHFFWMMSSLTVC